MSAAPKTPPSTGCPHPVEGGLDPAAADSSSTAAAERTQAPGEYVGEAESRESDLRPSAAWHRLSGVDPDARAATCSICGPGAPVRRRRANQWRCNAAEAPRRRTLNAESRRKYALHYKFGLSLDQYEQLLRVQGGVCAICLEPCVTRRNLAVDHDHRTGAVRGLLCNQCNRAIGLLRDDTVRLQRAISYLSK